MENKKRIDDQTLVRMCQDGNYSAFNIIALRYFSTVNHFVLMIVKDPIMAEDITQDTLIKAMVSIGANKYEERGSLRPWLLRIARNFCMDFLRKRKRKFSTSSLERVGDFDEESPAPIYLVPDQEPNPEEKLINKEIENLLQELIAGLEPNQREVVILRIVYDFSFKDIAQYLGISINTALGRMRYARINLKEKINKFNSPSEGFYGSP